MAINTRTEYALRALIELAGSSENALSAREICVRQDLPKKYVEHLLAGLKAAELISSSAGSRGGYVLSRAPEQIDLAQIMAAVEDNSLDLNCYACKESYCLGTSCTLSGIFEELTGKLSGVLSTYKLSDFIKTYNNIDEAEAQALSKEKP